MIVDSTVLFTRDFQGQNLNLRVATHEIKDHIITY